MRVVLGLITRCVCTPQQLGSMLNLLAAAQAEEEVAGHHDDRLPSPACLAKPQVCHTCKPLNSFRAYVFFASLSFANQIGVVSVVRVFFPLGILSGLFFPGEGALLLIFIFHLIVHVAALKNKNKRTMWKQTTKKG